jgi:hypothetical protein
MSYIGKKSDNPTDENFCPTIFPHSTQPTRRQSQISAATGYAPLPKTWSHITFRQRTQQPASKPPATAHSNVTVPEVLRNSGHDYLQTAVDRTIYSMDVIDAMKQLAEQSTMF